MRSSSPLLLALPALTLAAPPTLPRMYDFSWSGNGCTQSANLSPDNPFLGDANGVSLTTLKGSDSQNCQLHIQANGAPAGWQVAVKEVTYEGYVYLRGKSDLTTITTYYWSQDAKNTVRFFHSLERR